MAISMTRSYKAKSGGISRTRRAVLYLRVSDDHDMRGEKRSQEDRTKARSKSTTEQRKKMRAWAASNGVEIVREVVDDGIGASHSTRRQRQGWPEVMRMVEAGEVDVIVAWSLDRMLRRMDELHALIELYKRTDSGTLTVITLGSGELDLSTSGGRFTAKVLIAKAEMDIEELVERVTRGKEGSAYKGKPNGFVNAFGYADNGMTIIEDEADLIRDGAERALRGESYESIARDWNTQGARLTRGGKKWTSPRVSGVLRNPRYAGIVTYHGEELEGVQAAWEPILDRATYERLVALGALYVGGGRSPKKRNAFTRVFECECGNRMIRSSWGKARYKVYRCNRTTYSPDACGRMHIKAEQADRVALNLLLKEMENGPRGPRAKGDPNTATIREVARLEQEIKEDADLYGAGKITRTEWFAIREIKQQRYAALRAKLTRTGTSEIRNAWIGRADELREVWPTMDPSEQNAIARSVFVRIRVTREGIDPVHGIEYRTD